MDALEQIAPPATTQLLIGPVQERMEMLITTSNLLSPPAAPTTPSTFAPAPTPPMPRRAKEYISTAGARTGRYGRLIRATCPTGRRSRRGHRRSPIGPSSRLRTPTA